jgi:hypothetical protein
MNNPKQVQHRRLRFNSVNECLAEVRAIIAAQHTGKLRCTGNWTAGQVFNHLATWINYGYEGFPLKAPWFVRLIVRRKLKSYIRDGMPRGVHIPRVPNGTTGTEDMPVDAAADKFRNALHRLQTEPAKFDSPAFGKLTEEQRIAINLRHAELHMGYLYF